MYSTRMLYKNIWDNLYKNLKKKKSKVFLVFFLLCSVEGWEEIFAKLHEVVNSHQHWQSINMNCLRRKKTEHKK